MTIAAAMAREASGRELYEIIDEIIFAPLNLSEDTRFHQSVGDNIRYPGGPTGLFATPEDYGQILTAILNFDLVPDRQDWLIDRTSNQIFLSRFPTLESLNLDWHYGFGFWLECDDFPFSADCVEEPIISSPGGRGFTPWIDFEAGYWGIIVRDEPSMLSPTVESIRLEQIIQPLIEDILR